jgi:hypothetical protein
MGLKGGDIVAIRHYSVINPCTSYIIDFKDKFITVKLTRDFPKNSLFENDPIVLGYELNSTVYLLGCDIKSIDIEAGTVSLKIDLMIDIDPNKRRHERYPISLYADLITLDIRKKYTAIIKNLSQYGMLIYSKADLLLNQPIEVNIYTEKDVVFIKGTINRKTVESNYIKYGFEIKYENVKSINLIEGYIKKMKLSYEQQIKKLKTGF